MAPLLTFYEFFAGAGMARAGLGPKWRCAFANEYDLKKAATYRCNWRGPDVLKVADVKTLLTDDLPGAADLVWASFPCQDLSLAGAGAGLRGDRSGTFWPFWKLMQGVIGENRGPSLIVLENVYGTLTSHAGKDFTAICTSLANEGYSFGAVVMDAVYFLPQSRPRLFVIAMRGDIDGDATAGIAGCRSELWHPRGLISAYERLPPEVQRSWIWWNPPAPRRRQTVFADLIEDDPVGVEWHSAVETAKLLKMMSTINRDKVNDAKATGSRLVGAVYKRTRMDAVGRKVQRAEIRFDDIAGCLRTPAGGSSRQVIVIVHGKSVRSRLISPRETARLMGLPDSYGLPTNYNEAYHLTGDGVAVPVVRHLAQHIFEPTLLAHAQVQASQVAA